MEKAFSTNKRNNPDLLRGSAVHAEYMNEAGGAIAMRQTTSDRISTRSFVVGFSCDPATRSILMNKPAGMTNLKCYRFHSLEALRILRAIPS